MIDYDDNDLERWTRRFWEKEGEARWNYYFGPLIGFAESERPPEPLLSLEMNWANARGCLPTRDAHALTLAFLVGDRFEPLLQTIWAYHPQRIVPVLNEYYGDREGLGKIDSQVRWRELRQLIERLPPDHRPDVTSLPQGIPKLVADTPLDVFNFMRDQLRDDLADDERRVVIDITGAKKTMVAGAFLFAAFTNAEISYVDFDRYDSKYGPFGYTCRIASVTNPFQTWGLRYWERAAQLYAKSDFNGALQVLPEKLWDDAPDKWKAALVSLRAFIAVCREWENGDLYQANENRKNLTPVLQGFTPTTIEPLARYWPTPGTPHQRWVSERFLCSPRDLILYAQDEIERAKRLLGNATEGDARSDYRAAFSRAYALHETLIKARAVTLFVNKRVWVKLPESASARHSRNLTPEEWDQVLDRMHNAMLTDQALKLIRKTSEEKPAKAGHGDKQIALWQDPQSDPPRFSVPTPGIALQQKRNLFTHSYVPVSADDAEQAIALAESNLAQYRNDFQVNPPLPITALPMWDKLLDACNVNFIPRPRVSKQEVK